MKPVYLTAIVVFICDQASKLWILYGLDLQTRGSVEVFPPFLNFKMAWNYGINFGLFSNDANVMRWTLVALSLGISGAVLMWMRKDNPSLLPKICAGLLVGGALGNAIDRVMHGAVVDFLNMSCCGFNNPYAFNVADIFIFAGAIGLAAFPTDKKDA